MKTVLGLDLGTNSIGWALIEQQFEDKQGKILGMGSRIIPMSQDVLGEFGKGNSVSQTAERTGYRGVRRLRERYLLRRERLHRILNILGFLPEHYAVQIDFENRLGKFIPETEPKLVYHNRDFIFRKSFHEMLDDFKQHQSAILTNEKGEDRLVPYDWTIYYLRKKALSRKIEKEELAWILLNFNQKRGYYQLRGEEEEENPNKSIEFHSLKIIEVQADEPQGGKTDIWYSLTLENGWVYRRSSKTSLFDWKDKVRDFIVTTDLNDDGSVKVDKEGHEKRSFRAPGENDWTLVKKKTEQEIEQSNKTVGAYIYDTLLQNPKQKIKGKLVRTIERKFYKEELGQILRKQTEFHQELQDKDLYTDCVRELYRNNDTHQLTLSRKDFVHLFLTDIIFYQRPLRSQKSAIGNCALEYRRYKNKNGIEQIHYLKSIPKSNPFYQEFRLWQWIYNLKIYKKDDNHELPANDILNTLEDYEGLFDFLNGRKEIDQKALLKYFKLSDKTHRWNFVEDKKYPCNETKSLIEGRLIKVEGILPNFLTREIEQQLWHLIYSVTDKVEYEKALKSFALKHQLENISFIDNFKRFPPFKSEYGSYSEKAIKRLLPLIRIGKYWNWEAIDAKTKIRIQNIITGEYDETIKSRVREKTILLTEEQHFQGLQEWLAKYIVYDRHAEAGIAGKWNSVEDLDKYLEEFRQHSLRNPIVEQVVTEALRVVRDIWQQHGNGSPDFFDEIHIELGRDMKNNADERKRITNQVTENENTNLRIKSLLAEMLHYNEVENVRPFSPMQQEALKLFEEGVLSSNLEIEEDILKISKTAQPSSSELRRYKLWLEQKYRSPYTGEIIPLNRLFTADYEIEHIIPQSRFFDDSFSNKIICEAAVNTLKENQIGLQFIKSHHGTIVETGFGKKVKVFEVEAYEDFVKEHYAKNRSKRNKLLMEEIPEKMIERQLNDTRYISKFISSVLSNIVRSEKDDEGVNSKNILPGNGKITSILKHDWGLNDVWNELILPRFERMNILTDSTHFTTWNENYQKFLPTVPIELSKGFQKKRIDHRHHALDALVIACATRDHINLLNNKYAQSKERFDLNRKLRKFERVAYNHPQTGERIEKEVPKDFLKPWGNFTVDAKNSLETIVVSFKQNLRVINKTSNKYQKWVNNNGQKTKELVRQEKGDSWAIRKPMHKETVSGLIQLRKKKTISLSGALDDIANIVDKSFRRKIQSLVKNGFDKKKLIKYFKDDNNLWNNLEISKVEVFYWENDNVASRVALNDTFNEQRIETITDTGIQKILINHLNTYKSRLDGKEKMLIPEQLAFSPEGIEEMNKKIIELNGGKFHQPVFKVRTYEPKGNKFNVGLIGNKKHKYVEAAKGTNLFFAIYQDSEGKRSYETIPLNIIIERQKQGLGSVPLDNDKDGRLLFHLSPNDLVYVPIEEEQVNLNLIDFDKLIKEQVGRIYKMVSSSGNQCFFVKHDVATSIINKAEYSVLNKMEKSIDGAMIKDICIKLNVDRLGNIAPAGSTPDRRNRTTSVIISEAEVIYQKTGLRAFGSHEEMNEADAKEMATLSPAEHIQLATEITTKLFAEELKKPMNKKLRFR